MRDLAGIEHLYIRGTNATVGDFKEIFLDWGSDTFEDDRVGTIYRKNPRYMPLAYMGRVSGALKRYEAGKDMLSIKFGYDSLFDSCGLIYKFSTGELTKIGRGTPACMHHVMLDRNPHTYNEIHTPQSRHNFIEKIITTDEGYRRTWRRQKNFGFASKGFEKFCEKANGFLMVTDKSTII